MMSDNNQIKMDNLEISENDLNEGELYFTGRINPVAFDNVSNETDEPNKVRHVRYIYCSDGVVEECDEEEQEQAQKQRNEKKQEIENQIKLDQEAVSVATILSI